MISISAILWEFGSVSQTGDFQICLIGTGNTACKISSIEPAKVILGPDGFSSTPGKDNIAINAQPACTYAVAEYCDWLTVTPMNGLTTTAGQAFINYSVQANTSVSTRSCTVTFNGSPLTITQNGCTVPEPASGITVVSGTDPGCTGQNVTYRVPEITGATSYLWMLPDGTATSTVTNTLSFSLYKSS